MLDAIMGKLRSVGPGTKPDSIENCGLLLLGCLMERYMTQPQSRESQLLEALFKHALEGKDPALKELGAPMRFGLNRMIKSMQRNRNTILQKMSQEAEHANRTAEATAQVEDATPAAVEETVQSGN